VLSLLSAAARPDFLSDQASVTQFVASSDKLVAESGVVLETLPRLSGCLGQIDSQSAFKGESLLAALRR